MYPLFCGERISLCPIVVVLCCGWNWGTLIKRNRGTFKWWDWKYIFTIQYDTTVVQGN